MYSAFLRPAYGSVQKQVYAKIHNPIIKSYVLFTVLAAWPQWDAVYLVRGSVSSLLSAVSLTTWAIYCIMNAIIVASAPKLKPLIHKCVYCCSVFHITAKGVKLLTISWRQKTSIFHNRLESLLYELIRRTHTSSAWLERIRATSIGLGILKWGVQTKAGKNHKPVGFTNPL